MVRIALGGGYLKADGIILYVRLMNKQTDLPDYKLMCFNGRTECSFVCSERNTGTGLKVTFFDRDWNRMPFERHYPQSSLSIRKPQHYTEMIQLAETLTSDLPFARVDFYEAAGKIYFGEITLYPGSGFEEFNPIEWDTTLGEWLILPAKRS